MAGSVIELPIGEDWQSTLLQWKRLIEWTMNDINTQINAIST